MGLNLGIIWEVNICYFWFLRAVIYIDTAPKESVLTAVGLGRRAVCSFVYDMGFLLKGHALSLMLIFSAIVIVYLS